MHVYAGASCSPPTDVHSERLQLKTNLQSITQPTIPSVVVMGWRTHASSMASPRMSSRGAGAEATTASVNLALYGRQWRTARCCSAPHIAHEDAGCMHTHSHTAPHRSCRILSPLQPCMCSQLYLPAPTAACCLPRLAEFSVKELLA